LVVTIYYSGSLVDLSSLPMPDRLGRLGIRRHGIENVPGEFLAILLAFA